MKAYFRKELVQKYYLSGGRMVEGGKRERRESMQKYPTIPLSEERVIDVCSIKMFYLIQSCTATLPKQFSF